MSTNSKTVWMADQVVQTPINYLKPYAQNNRTHTAKSVARLKGSLERFGFVVPILASGDGYIIAGHGRLEAAKQLGLDHVPVVTADHLSDAEIERFGSQTTNWLSCLTGTKRRCRSSWQS